MFSTTNDEGSKYKKTQKTAEMEGIKSKASPKINSARFINESPAKEIELYKNDVKNLLFSNKLILNL